MLAGHDENGGSSIVLASDGGGGGPRSRVAAHDGSLWAALDSDCGLYWHPMVDHDRGGS